MPICSDNALAGGVGRVDRRQGEGAAAGVPLPCSGNVVRGEPVWGVEKEGQRPNRTTTRGAGDGAYVLGRSLPHRY